MAYCIFGDVMNVFHEVTSTQLLRNTDSGYVHYDQIAAAGTNIFHVKSSSILPIHSSAVQNQSIPFWLTLTAAVSAQRSNTAL